VESELLKSVGPASPPMTKSWSTRVSFTQEVMLPPLPLEPDLPPLPPPLLPPLSLPPLADWPALPPELVPALPPLEAPPDPSPPSPPPEPQATITETIPRADASEKGRSMTSTREGRFPNDSFIATPNRQCTTGISAVGRGRSALSFLATGAPSSCPAALRTEWASSCREPTT